MGPENGAPATWEDVLDRLEADLALAEQALLRREEPVDLDDWIVPALISPLPAELAERAAAIVARQREILARLPEALGRTGRQQALTARIGHVSSLRTSVPVYIDASA